MRRWASIGLLLVACSGTPAPPPVTPVDEVCASSFCVTAPAGWLHLVEGDSISFSHPADPAALASASMIDMAWMLESTGSSWPASLESVISAYWSLLDVPPLAPEQVLVSPGGWVESKGHFEGSPRWHSLFPVEGGPLALAVTVQVPAETWRQHARTFLDGVTLLQ